MRVINNTDYAIYVGDIGVNIHSSKNGPYEIRDDLFVRSEHLGFLIKSGKVSVPMSLSKSVRTVCEDGKNLFVVSGDEVWPGVGKTVPELGYDNTSRMSFCEFNALRREHLKTVPKRYVITRSCGMNVSLEKISCILTKQNPSIEISEDYYNSKEIKSSIAAGRVALSRILCSSTDPQGNLCMSEFKPGIEEKAVGQQKTKEYDGVKCSWTGPFFDAGGYANMNRQYVINLDNLGVLVKPLIPQQSSEVEKTLMEKVERLSRNNVGANSPKVYSRNVPGNNTGLSITYTMMETEFKVHKDLSKQFGVTDEVWVPSEWNKGTYSNSGIKKPIYVMPLGVDCELYKPREKSVFFSFPVKKYVFYAVSTWIWRKGWDVLLKAYTRAFTADDDVSLVIFSHVPLTGVENYKSYIEKYISTQFSGKDTSKFPHLAIITSVLPAAVVPLIYNSADCFVLFSRGEGWGLPYCEAAASGLPIVGADHGGQKMFLNDENALLVKPDLVSSCHTSLLPMSSFYPGMKFVNYSEKAINEASDKMRYAYEHQDEMKAKANVARENIISNFTWEKCAKRVADRLKELQ